MSFVAFVVGATADAKAQDLFPRFDMRLDGQYVTSDDSRFNWSFNFGADLDVIDWGGGRAAFIANYEAIAGEQFRRFDVNQGNYLLEGVLAFRVRAVEIGPVWHHVSRHLSDRPKRFPIDWNMIAVRLKAGWDEGATAVNWTTDLRATVTKAFVDYDWEMETVASVVRPLGSRLAAVGSGGIRVVGVDGSRGRGTQVAGRAEAGLRLKGRVAAAELFAGLERRIDPLPVEFGTANWFLAGLRLTTMP